MSHSTEMPTTRSTKASDLPFDFNTALSLETDKPDSPVSTLFTHQTTSTTSSTSSSAGSSLAARRTHSGEILSNPFPKPGHRRTGSGPLIFTGSGTTNVSTHTNSTASSPVTNFLPAGNICPSGKIAKPSTIQKTVTHRNDLLGSGTGHYGHGSIIRGGAATGTGTGIEDFSSVKRAMVSVDLEEVKRIGNDLYKKGQLLEALRVYDRAVGMQPDNAVCRSNKAAALIGLRRFGEAVQECEEAVRLDPGFSRAHQRLASLFLRLGVVENSKKHLLLASAQPDLIELHKLQTLEKHLTRCADARRSGDWKIVLRETDSAITAGADSSPLIFASKAEACLRLHQIDDADMAICDACKLDSSFSFSVDTKYFGFVGNSYIHYVHALVEMARGRFETAVGAAEKARKIDPANSELNSFTIIVKSVARARSLGNELFNSGKFTEASLAYGEGLRHDPSNPVLYCNRAACRYKLGQWDKSIEDCNEALRIQPNYTKALLRRAASYAKIERWAESVRDYEALRKELPGDTEVAEALFHAQVALKSSRGEEVANMKFGGEVELISGLDQFHTAISLPGVSVVHFMAPLNPHCSQMAPFLDALCARYPSVNFLKVDVIENPAVAKAENVRMVPTFKIYKNGNRVKEMVCPSQQLLEYSVRHYGF
ncbi:TPR repeat-containing thioredoxin TTL1 [Rhynchospora pubera]|uniref:TPR repeat-containing thioredoxin TTL1 n=1 Tax=Rhynchospora pubera TaxID=906938 RepID=A0AAV8DGV9_9POAL|nr:TPR repeat-containing thioredoxin TTL1 [Rhynchospora pubera]